ncbi:MAG: GNAT family N-acetyltransferase [Gammaproteobacteria bacterium]
MQSTILGNIRELTAEEWNGLIPDDNPFIKHEFLATLEEHHCVGQKYGWLPQHIAIHDADGQLIGAAPMYLKDNSYGELVFDWSWADAYQRSGLRYYPKLVTAIPYTPVTGPRLLVAPSADPVTTRQALIDSAIALAEQHQLSSIHWLFTNAADTGALHANGLALRLGCQFHWRNHAYASFADFLQGLTAPKRKMIKRERRRVQEQDIHLEVYHGDEMSEQQWHVFHRFYESTFERKSGMPTLSLPFFMSLAERMPGNMVIVLARHDGQYVAGAFNMRSKDTLYGRHWGCSADYHSLHFEACYYQGLEYCITNQLQSFEPGAQGEHKISRGFLPTPTWSAHWIAHPEFRNIIYNYCQYEQQGMENYIAELQQHSPYRQA